MVQIQKQGQKVIVNINEKKNTVKRKRRAKRTKRDGNKSGVSQISNNPYPFVPPIVITPFGNNPQYQSNPQPTNPLMRDITLDSIRTGGGLMASREVPREIMATAGAYSAENPLLSESAIMRARRLERFGNENSTNPSLADSFQYDNESVASGTNSIRSVHTDELLLSPSLFNPVFDLPSRQVAFSDERPSRIVDNLSMMHRATGSESSRDMNQETPVMSLGDIGITSTFGSSSRSNLFTPDAPIRLVNNQEIGKGGKVSSGDRMEQAREVSRKLILSREIGADVPLEILLKGQYNLSSQKRRAYPTIIQRHMLYEAGKPFKGDENGVAYGSKKSLNK